MKNNSGFTLIELIVVIVILAILSTATVAIYTGSLQKSKASSDLENARVLASKISTAIAENRIPIPASNVDVVAPSGGTNVVSINGYSNFISDGYLLSWPVIKGIENATIQWLISIDTAGRVAVGVSIDGTTGTGATNYQKLYPKTADYTIVPYDKIN